jgi:hypothetical protein
VESGGDSDAKSACAVGCPKCCGKMFEGALLALDGIVNRYEDWQREGGIAGSAPASEASGEGDGRLRSHVATMDIGSRARNGGAIRGFCLK